MNRKSNGAPSALQQKSLEISGFKILNDAEGIVEAFVAGIGNKDSGKDIIQPGAFVDSLQKRNPKCCWSHDWKQTVGKVLEIQEVDAGDPRLPPKLQAAGAGGLYAKVAFNLRTTRGKDAYEDVKFFGDEGEWSIGYEPTVANYSKELDANLLHKIDLYEISPVAFGMNALTSTVSVKTEFDGDDLTVKILGVDDDEISSKISEAVKSIIQGEEEGSAVDSGTNEPEVPTGTKEGEGSAETTEESKKEVKVVRGSFEERSRALENALEDLYDGYYVWVRATFDSNVIYEVCENSYADAIEDAIEAALGTTSDEDAEESKEGTWAASYQMADDGTVTFGAPTAVQLAEIVVAKYALAEAISKGHTAEADQMVKSISTQIDEKVGRVLSKANRDKVQAAKEALDAVLSADTKEESETPAAEEKTSKEVETKSIEIHSTETSDDEWSGSKQWSHLLQDAVALREATAWVDPEAEQDKKDAYKFIHHFVDEEGKVGAASVKACATGMKVLGSAELSDEDKKSVFEHLLKHLTDAGDIDESLKAQIDTLAADLGVDLEGKAEDNTDEKAYEIRKSGSQYCVHNQDTGEKVPGGCHSSRSDALKHMRALYANVEDASKEEDVTEAEKTDENHEVELPIEVTLDEEAENIDEKSEETSEESDVKEHEFRAWLPDNASTKAMPCADCGEAEASEVHIKAPELVEIDILELANLELLLAE